MAENINSFEAEIQDLEAKLEAKKLEMAKSGVEQSERHTFKEVVRQHTGHETPSPSFTPSGAVPKTGTGSATQTVSKQDEVILDELVTHAFTKGILSAVAEAKKTGSPFLVDMLHDRLADEYYQKLLDARKLTLD